MGCRPGDKFPLKVLASLGHDRVNANTNLLIKVEIMINKDELSLFYPKVLKGLRKLWQGRDVK
jgi:hypothetical protein